MKWFILLSVLVFFAFGYLVSGHQRGQGQQQAQEKNIPIIMTDTCANRFQGMPLHNKIVLRHFYNGCGRCNDSTFTLARRLRTALGKDRLVLSAGLFSPVNEIALRRVYQMDFGHIFSVNGELTPMDNHNPRLDYIYFTDTISCKTTYYLLESFDNNPFKTILSDIESKTSYNR